jgi:hypothetical protein
MKKLLITAALLLATAHAHATTPRGNEAPRLFRKANACPSTGKFTGPCSDYVMDHMRPLACGGLDVPENLMWQTVEEGKAKDRWELQCWRYYQGGK